MDNGMDDFGEGDDNVESDDDGADRKCTFVSLYLAYFGLGFSVQLKRR
jgi:hypothetical protein